MTNNVNVIIGASIELGRVCALRAAHEGGIVMLVDSDQALLDEVAIEVEEAGARPVVVVTPLDDLTRLSALGRDLPEGVEHCDTLVNCQFAFDMANVSDVDLTLWESVVRTNLSGPVAAVQGLLPQLERSSRASVVNVGTIDGLQGNPWLPAYSASKGGLVALTHVMAHDLGPRGIRVNYVARCGTKEMKDVLQAASGKPLREDWEESLSSFTPLGRVGSADETAAVVQFLWSDAASFVSGSVLTVDGGRTGITPGV